MTIPSPLWPMIGQHWGTGCWTAQSTPDFGYKMTIYDVLPLSSFVNVRCRRNVSVRNAPPHSPIENGNARRLDQNHEMSKRQG